MRSLIWCLLVISPFGCAADLTESLAWFSTREQVFLPQWALTRDGTEVIVWRENGKEGTDLFFAHADKGVFSPVTRINDQPHSVAGYTNDEMRASVAVGPNGLLAVAWTDNRDDIRVAIAKNFSFGPSLKLNQDTGKSYQAFPAISFDSKGTLHAIWLDARSAKPGAEEPANLYHAAVTNGKVKETNLTAQEKATTCGCCRPFLAVDEDDQLRINFRKANLEGYRDIFEITGKAGKLSAPVATSLPVWKIAGCPMAGPIVAAGATLWNDASIGKRRLLQAAGPNHQPKVVLQDTETWQLLRPPREVISAGKDTLVLVPGTPHSILLEYKDGAWNKRLENLPTWAVSAIQRDGKLHLIGSQDGKLKAVSHPTSGSVEE